MQFSNASDTSLGLYQDAQYLAGVDSNAFKLVDFTRSANRYYYRAAVSAWKASSIWDFDDTNKTDFPVATTTLVNNQADYQIPTNALKILRVEVKDSSGEWSRVLPFDETQVGVALPEFYETAGVPKFYRAVSNSIILYPAPDTTRVTASAGLQLYFLREVTEFTTASTTTEPGLPEPFHRILSLGAAYDFCLAKGMDKAPSLKAETEQLMNELTAFFTGRLQDFKLKVRPRIENYV